MAQPFFLVRDIGLFANHLADPEIADHQHTLLNQDQRPSLHL